MTNFKVGDKVVYAAYFMNSKGKLSYNDYETPAYGVVSHVVDDSLVVKWDKTNYLDSDKLYKKNLIMLKSEFDSSYSQIESEFNEVKNKIDEKLTEAKKLIDESNDLARNYGASSLREFNFDTDILRSIGNAGWNTSSMSC